MAHDRWKEIDDLFEQALDLQQEERRAFLEALSERDEELSSGVNALLGAVESSSRFLETPVGEACAPPWGEVFASSSDGGRTEPEDRSGERVGPYRLVRRLGRGGMATVYLAQRADGLWKQQVALKLIRHGLDSQDVVRRFLTERQILSSLRHPNIASLLDGGTLEDGLPYLVMEYVDGTPITEYCDERRLSVDRRLRLFCEVGRAVQHAHRSLIVHRDLKPSNILVTDQGRVKLLDFGIAKLLDPELDPGSVALTRPGHRPLTPQYASPEQLAGGPITTASDIYQLGVLLHRLLCGRRPQAARWARSPSLAPRAATGKPTRPSRAVTAAPAAEAGKATAATLASRRRTTPERLARRLRGDLDMIVGKSLRGDPSERYDSAAALVEDVERHLEAVPIRARAPARGYRLRKFLQRNRWVAPVTLAALLATGMYAFTVQRQTRALERERNVARAEAERADEIRAFMAELFRSANPFTPADPERGREITVAQSLEIGAARVRSEMESRPALQADLLGAIADVYSSLGLAEQAIRLRRESLALVREIHGPDSPEAASHVRALGNVVADTGTRDEAEALLQEALVLTRNLFGEGDTIYAGVLKDLGYLASNQGRHAEAMQHLEEALSILETADPLPERQLASVLGALTSVYPPLGRPDDAVRAGERSLRYIRRTRGEGHPRTALAMVQLANAHDWQDELGRAVELYRSAVPIMERTLGEDHSETMNSINNLGVSLLKADELEQAEAVFRRILELRIRRYGERHEDVGSALQNLAATLSRMGRWDEAEGALSRAHEIFIDALEPGHFQTAFPLLTLSEIRLERGNLAGAEASASEAARVLRSSLPEGHFATAVAECRWGRALAGLGRTPEATPLLEGAATQLLSAPGAGRHREPCLAAATEHLRGIEAPRERWAPFAQRLRELRDGTSADG